VLDAAILARLEQTWSGRTEAQRSAAWIDRQMSRISVALQAMSKGLGDKAWCFGTHFSLADIAVGCTLGYLDFRFPRLDWRSAQPNLTRLADKLAARPSFIDTAPPRP
jgi:glutathione S-transferase